MFQDEGLTTRETDSLQISYRCSFGLDASLSALLINGLVSFFFFFVLSYFDCQLDFVKTYRRSQTCRIFCLN